MAKKGRIIAVALLLAFLALAMIFTLWGVATGKLPSRHGYGQGGPNEEPPAGILTRRG